MRLGTRLFLLASLLLAGTLAAVVLLVDRAMRRYFEAEVAQELEREARLVARVLPADSAQWPEAAIRLGALLERRITLIGPDGRVRGDAAFGRTALARLENHLARPEVRAALASGTGRAERLSASTNQRQVYVAIRGGPPGLGAVRLSATLASVDARVAQLQRAVAAVGLGALALAAFLAWVASRALARPLEQLAATAQQLAAGRPAHFPSSRIPEISAHIESLRVMAGELERRFLELRQERAETERLLEAMHDAVVAADASGRITALNAAARRMLGYPAGTEPPPLPQLFHDRAARELVQAVLAGREVAQHELALGERTILATGQPLPGGGSLLVLRDVTALRRLETVRRDFVANVSHELKTPLTAIVGYAETLVQETPAGPSQQFAQVILEHARRMQRLVDDLLDLSRIESGGWQPAPAWVELEPAVREAWVPVAELAARQGVRLVPPGDPAARLWVDPGALHQILVNLFDNAVRYSPPGAQVRVELRLEPLRTILAVQDTGPGIPPEHLARIFERFYRVDSARSRQAGGTGLGLAIVKHLVEAHGGRVEAESTLGQGTTIRLQFPTPPAS